MNAPLIALPRAPAVAVSATAGLRVLQVAVWPVVMLIAPESGLRDVGLAVGVYVVQTAWSLAFAAGVARAGRIPQSAVLVDVAIAACALVASGLACDPADATTLANSAVTPAIGAAVAAGVALRGRAVAASVLALMAGYGAGVGAALTASTKGLPVAAANLAILAAIGAAAFLASRALARAAQARAEERRELAAARAALAAAEQADRDRRRQYRTLHDTVLSTLSALARGGLDGGDLLVRQRCAADADYLRALITAGESDGGGQLHAELAALARDQAGLGLRTQVRCADLPRGIPVAVVDAVVSAVREALNNVVKHSGQRQAWVTALGAGNGPGFTVTVTDRGCGFDPTGPSAGSGLRRSIGERMAGIGGTLRVESGPGLGTTVELAWPGAAVPAS